MAVTVESDGWRNVLRIEDNDIQEFIRRNNGWEISFRSATYTTNKMDVADVERDYIKRSEVAENYIKKETLIELLRERRDVISAWGSRARNDGRLSTALACEIRAREVGRIASDVEIDEISIPASE